MASDSSIKFEGIEGEMLKPKGEVEVLSWNWDIAQPAATAGGGQGQGKAVPGEFSFTHLYDKSSPVLAKKCAEGNHFPTAVLTARKAGGGQQDFLKVTMKEVYITSCRPAGHSGGDITEIVNCTYKDIEFAYKPQDDKGALGGEVKFGYNFAETTAR